MPETEVAREHDFDELAFLSDELGRPTDYFLRELG
jgi:hypothetical protein